MSKDQPKRPTAGRPKKSHAPGRHNVYLDDDVWAHLTRLPEISASFAITLYVKSDPTYHDLPAEKRTRT